MLRIYKSSAGSGKTFTLVKEYLRLALSGKPDQYKHILAITFTNKAANEMKERIISTLRELADAKPHSTMGKQLLEILKISASELQQRATALLTAILHHYADLSVSTIDSFVHRLIRSFAYDLQLPANFEIEMDTELLLTQAVKALLSTIREDEKSPVAKALIDFSQHKLNEGKNWNIEDNLITFARELFKEDAYQYIDQLVGFKLEDFLKVREHLYAIKKAFETKITTPAQEAMALIASKQLSVEDFYYGKNGIYAYLNRLATDTSKWVLEPKTHASNTIQNDKWTAPKSSSDNKALVESIKGRLASNYQQIQATREQGESSYLVANLLSKNIYSFMLLTEVNKMLQIYKHGNNILHISEFQQRISAIVSEQEAPIIYERIGDWYDSILIDEFQDTSKLQWRNLLPLIENSQTKNQDSLIVGDGKQAIYRFRGGEVEQFAALPRIYQSEDNPLLQERETVILNYGVEDLSLHQNFRSKKEIIDFNNALYDFIARQPEFAHAHIYEKQAQVSGTEKEGGFVSIDFIEQQEKDSYDDTVCYHVHALLHQLKDKHYDWKDIAILCRTNNKGRYIASYLMQQGIPVVSTESLLIAQSNEVRAIISFLYYLVDKDNAIKRTELLYYCDPASIGRALEVKHYLSLPYTDFEKYISTITGTIFDSSTLVQNRLPELAQSLIRLFPFLQKEDSFIQFFLDELLQYALKNSNRISGFLEWWEENKSKKSIIYPQSMNAVKVLTIHKAKGLQYPVVILPDAYFKAENSKDYVWTELEESYAASLPVFPLPLQKDLENTRYAALYLKEKADSLLDMVNMLYVATTRAEDRLYIICKTPAKEEESLTKVTPLIVRFLKDKGLWNGYIPYQLGNNDTVHVSKGGKDSIGEFVYQAVSNQHQKMISFKRKSSLKWDKNVEEHRVYGTLLHHILSQIIYSTDAPLVIERFFNEGLLHTAHREKVMKDINAIIQSTELRQYYSPAWKVYNERALLAADKSLHRPDRVMIKRNSKDAVIIDYKTGEERTKHKAQILDYAMLLRKNGYTIVNTTIVYTENQEIVIINL